MALDLFAISGPTGAGKSSLLDAMIFALYGKVPRVGKNYTECIALGRDRLVVTLDFRVGERSFRVTRTGRRKGAGSAQLDEIIEGEDDTRPLVDQVREVDRHVEALLGLGYEAFTQAVVLPQNEFAEFLQSEPRERQKILSSLLRLDVYERMKKRAGELASKLDSEVKAYERRLAEDYAGATEQSVAALSASLLEVRTLSQSRAGHLEQTQVAVDLLKRRHEKTRELEQEQATSRKSREREPAIRDSEARIATAKRAAPVLPRLDAARSADDQVSEADTRRKLQSSAVTSASKAVEACTTKLDTAKEAAAEVPALEKRVRALDELKGAIKSREIAERKLAEALETVGKQEAERTARLKELAAGRKDLAAQEKRATHLQAAALAIGYDPARAKKLDAWRDRATQLSEQRAAVTKAEQAALVADQRAAKEKVEAHAATKALGALQQQHKQADEAFDKVDEVLRASEAEHHASTLRADLHVGEPCPVCEQEISKLPGKGKTPKLDALRDRHLAAKLQLEQLRTKLSEEERATSKIVTAGEKSAERAQELQAGIRDAHTSIDRLETRMEEGIGTLIGGKKTLPIEERVLKAVTDDIELRERFEKAAADRDEAVKKQVTLERSTEKLDGLLTALGEKSASTTARAQEHRDEIARVAAEVRKVTKHSEPLVEREEVAARCKELEERVTARQDELKALSRTLDQEGAKEKEIGQQLKGLQRLAARMRSDADVGLKDAGFSSETAARKAAMPVGDLRRLETEVGDYRRDTHALGQRIAALETALDKQYVIAAQYAHAEGELKSLRSAYEAGIAAEAGFKQELAELKRKFVAAQEIANRLEQDRSEHKQYAQLATDLRSDRFQEFILREAFSELVARASQRLFNLSGRYTLSMQDGEFDVLDRDNAGERRSARTLSGGETFLASLALALELSEQVQRAAGAVALDSLFIDEGFGSLDPEALDIATDAIQSLPQGGRMVGIITHLPELTARLDSKVIIEKRADGSRIRVEAR